MKSGLDLTNRLKYASWIEGDRSDLIDPRMLAFDIDGVVADTMAIFVELVRERLGLRGFSKEHLSQYNLHECVPAPAEAIDEILCLTLSDEYTARIPPCPGAQEVLGKLGRFVPLRFVTARIWPDSIMEWLRRLLSDVDPENIQVTATGDPAVKAEVLRKMGIKAFVEDRPDTCCSLKEQGFHVIIFDQPWNRHTRGFPRIRDLRQLECRIDWSVLEKA
ncbi:5' nucleotidase, NT5C type [Thermodesulforhabdus norvegica]|uniref:Uncharacterized protein n=1 Tax=Thermodesulforhabdus norvegica TaxID=39841 RepID=A0A1I4V8D6_9BACT|nr:haloacid dehalogenase [Thermodesulforhabdus norvegica]SFM97418.1 hypothetical protein SAMN05660836_02164 [Thermodesulforhabdus norvegica]